MEKEEPKAQADFNSDGFYPLESPHFPEKPDLRDMFASYALLGIAIQGDTSLTIDRAAEKAYKLADAMMSARKAKPKV